MNKRIVGIDVARALAVIGMIVVNFKMVFGKRGNPILEQIIGIFDGKAAATFVVLAGVGMAFMTNSSYQNNDIKALKVRQIALFKRALFLFVVGVSYLVIWPADILHFYGIYMIISLLLIKVKPKLILLFAICLILLYPLFMLFLDYESGWNFNTFEYSGFWTIKGFSLNLFYNGFHPVIPWTAFMLIGLWFGRQNLQDKHFVKKALVVSLIVFVFIKILSVLSISLLSEGSEDVANELAQILGTSPMPPLPIYMFSGSSIAIFIICSCILISNKFENSFFIVALIKTGKLALTFYVAHVVIGMGLLEMISTRSLGGFSLEFSVIYAMAFSLLCIVFATIWMKYFSIGPIEWIMRKITT